VTAGGVLPWCVTVAGTVCVTRMLFLDLDLDLEERARKVSFVVTRFGVNATSGVKRAERRNIFIAQNLKNELEMNMLVLGRATVFHTSSRNDVGYLVYVLLHLTPLL